eukprot:gene50666-40036_t
MVLLSVVLVAVAAGVTAGDRGVHLALASGEANVRRLAASMMAETAGR